MFDLKSLSIIVVAIAALILLLIYKRPLESVLYKIARAKKIKGFGLELSGESEVIDIQQIQEDKDRERLPQLSEKKEDSWIECLYKKEYDKAIRILENKISQEKDKEVIVDLECYLGLCLARKNFQDGIKKFEIVIEKYPKDNEPYFWLASTYRNADLFDEAISILDKGISIVDNKISLLKDKARFLKGKGRLEESINILKNILQENNNDKDAYLILADVYLKKEDKESVISSYKQALRIDPNSEEALSGYASFLNDSEKKENALAVYKKLITLFPQNSTYWTLLGNIYLDLDLNSNSLECYEKANEIAKEKEGWILANIGNLYKNRGFYSKGIYFLKKASEIEPNSEYAHNRLSASLKLKEEEDKKAKDIIDKVEKG